MSAALAAPDFLGEKPEARKQALPCVPRMAGRHALALAVLLVCCAVMVRAFFVDSYQILTGSMAPTLFGRHRACVCPRCGYLVRVGVHSSDDGSSNSSLYRRAWCPNCGAGGLPLSDSAIVPGQRLLVNKTAFAARSPRRWEIVVFHMFGLDFIKRLLGLAGETIQIKDGDLYVDGMLCRKTLDEFKAMRILVFDNNYQPQPMTWAARWESASVRPTAVPLAGTELHLNAAPGAWHLVAYRHFCIDTQKLLPLQDEYAYNSAEPRRLVPVHDIMLECDVEILASGASFVLGITDGHDHLLARLPVVEESSPIASKGCTVRGAPSFSLPALDDLSAQVVAASGVSLLAGKRYHVEMALVDRRLTLRIDGVDAFAPVDLPACVKRAAVVRPVMFAIRGGRAVASNVRLWRDVHYTQAGGNGVAGAVVRLGPDQYFVLGDNSPASEDSRFWPGGGAVPGPNLIGTPLVVAQP
jgi:signal peptidase I